MPPPTSLAYQLPSASIAMRVTAPVSRPASVHDTPSADSNTPPVAVLHIHTRLAAFQPIHSSAAPPSTSAANRVHVTSSGSNGGVPNSASLRR